MSDCIIITSEVYSALKARKSRGVIMKLDFAKAFDTVRWDFVYQTLDNISFGPKGIQCIKRVLESSKISVLVNGVPTNEFTLTRGLC